jgi:hypothetical protein
MLPLETDLSSCTQSELNRVGVPFESTLATDCVDPLSPHHLPGLAFQTPSKKGLLFGCQLRIDST